MFRFIEVLLLSMWILTVFATPDGYDRARLDGRKNRLDLSVDEVSVVDDDEETRFHKNNKYRWKSEEKCAEYAQAVGQTTWILPLSASRPIPISTECKPLINPLISGGEIAESGEFPHMAAIGWLLENGTIGYYCGGSLISDRWILTAAHCTHGTLGQPVAALLGSIRLTDKKSGLLIRIETVRRHPAYRPPSMYADIALLKLTRKVNFDSNVKPACLHSQFGKAPSRAWVTGWGSTEIDMISCGCGMSKCTSNCGCRKLGLKCKILCSQCNGVNCANAKDLKLVVSDDEMNEDSMQLTDDMYAAENDGTFSITEDPENTMCNSDYEPEGKWSEIGLIGEDPSDVLIKASLDVIDNLRCALLHNVTTSVPRGIVPSMLCAGDPNGGWKKDTCQGDSGGPLQSLHRNNCLYEIIGITSFGKLCASPDLPGVYTRVSHYIEWIESTVWPEGV